jgi:C4-dicarboxylate-specific signal transduction histidine kinase
MVCLSCLLAIALSSLRQDKQTVNQRREDNVMAKRQDKQTVNQRREDNAMAKRQDKQTINQRRDLWFVCLVF